MKLEDQICPVYEANELAGFIKLDTHYTYILMDGEDLDDARLIKTSTYEKWYKKNTEYIPCPAPTFAELCNALPEDICIDNVKWSITHCKYDSEFCTDIMDAEGFDGSFRCFTNEHSITQPPAEALIWLYENNHIKTEKE